MDEKIIERDLTKFGDLYSAYLEDKIKSYMKDEYHKIYGNAINSFFALNERILLESNTNKCYELNTKLTAIDVYLSDIYYNFDTNSLDYWIEIIVLKNNDKYYYDRSSLSIDHLLAVLQHFKINYLSYFDFKKILEK